MRKIVLAAAVAASALGLAACSETADSAAETADAMAADAEANTDAMVEATDEAADATAEAVDGAEEAAEMGFWAIHVDTMFWSLLMNNSYTVCYGVWLYSEVYTTIEANNLL